MIIFLNESLSSSSFQEFVILISFFMFAFLITRKQSLHFRYIKLFFCCFPLISIMYFPLMWKLFLFQFFYSHFCFFYFIPINIRIVFYSSLRPLIIFWMNPYHSKSLKLWLHSSYCFFSLPQNYPFSSGSMVEFYSVGGERIFFFFWFSMNANQKCLLYVLKLLFVSWLL